MIALLLLAVSAAVPESAVLGDWCAGSKSAFYEEFSLEKDGEVRSFHSWIHSHPASSGIWELTARTLTNPRVG